MAVKNGFPGFTFGADPEVFIADPDGRFVSAAGIIPGTKHEPHKVEGGAVQVDGFAAEFNINPASTFSEFNRNIETVLRQLERMLPEGHTWHAFPSVRFRQEEFDAAPETSKELGCEPDFDAWTQDINPPPEPEDPLMRCAGGHLHIGWREGGELDAEHLNDCYDLVKQLDWHLAAWALRLDGDANRRKLYGKAGACRIKDYGVEYRTLSNFWIVSRERRLYVWNRMQNALNDMRNRFLPELYPDTNQKIVEAINTSSRNYGLEKTFRYPLVTEDKGIAFNTIQFAEVD